ncbi:MAG: antibiotic biosynthesis monooxygenase [Chitinophagaceae bacterium]|nr:antibiotic biosynthesis monooxygenase [Chitinophagaceae bacterium]
MLIRLVKMSFRDEAIPAFLQLFNERKQQIRDFDGCLHVELWQERLHANIFFTYSHWVDATALDHYRNSPFFADTWQQTKQLFNERPEAWSVNRVSISG